MNKERLNYFRPVFPTLNSNFFKSLLVLFFLLVIPFKNGFSQVNCTGDTPFFSIDLTGSPAGTWMSPSVVRDGSCCGGGANQVNCIELSITLDPGADGIVFNVETGANPGGALYYQVDCNGIPVASGSETVCLTGVGPHLITYCKVGNNQNTYSITSIPTPASSGDITMTVDGSCTELLSVDGLDPNTVSWNSISPGYSGEYNNYLSNSDGTGAGSQGVSFWGSDTVIVTPDASAPSIVYYEVCGIPQSDCVNSPFCDTVAVTIYPSLGATISPVEPAICYGQTSVELTANPNGGTPPHTFNWSNGDTGSSTFVSAPGQYSVIINDQTGCAFAYDTVTVVEFLQEITANAGPDILVCDAPVPTINVTGTVTGVTTGIWSNGSGTYTPDNTSLNLQYTPSASEMAAGTVSLILSTTNNLTCPGDQDTVEIILPPYFSGLQMTSTDVTCFGLCNGSATAQPNGGLAPFSYVWEQGGTAIGQNTQTASGLCAGTYDVTVTDAAGCQAFGSVTITEPPALSGSLTPTDVLCNGQCTGQVDVMNVAGGTTPYQYSINGGAFQTGTNFTGLCAGPQQVVLRDSNNCTLVLNTTINQPPLLSVNITGTTPVTCGSNNGTLSVSGNGGTAPYLYSIGGASQTGNLFTGLAPGSYTVTVTDSNNCTATVNANITTIAQPTAFVDDKNDLFCFGSNNGSVLIGTTGAFAPVTYSLNGGVPQASNSFTGLAEGSYTVDVVDGNGCMANVSFSITAPPFLSFTSTPTAASCYGVCDGEIEVNASGGTPPYSYSSDGGTTFSPNNILTNLCPGPVEIEVVVSDYNGCLSNSQVMVPEPAPVTASFNKTDPLCNGSCDGSIDVLASGGTSPYVYSVNGGATQTSSLLTGLCAGTKNLKIIDDNGCTLDTTQTLYNPPAIIIDQVSMTPSNCGFNDGALEVSASGVNPPFLYSANGSPNQASGVFSNLLAGAYKIVVTDNIGCQDSSFFGVNDIQMNGELVGKTDVSCYGGNDGTVQVNNLAGADPISFELDNSGVTQTNGFFNNLYAGNHIVTIYDAGFCIYTVPFVINQPDEIAFNTNIQNVACNGGSSGSIEFTNVTGGVGGYQYSIDGGFVFQTNPVFNGLNAGNYTLLVMDTNNCFVSGNVSVSESPLITVSPNIYDLSCNSNNTGVIQVVAGGGAGGFTYSNDNGVTFQSSPVFSGLAAGTYDLMVEDANGCLMSQAATVTEPLPLSFTSTTTDAKCNGVCDGEIAITANGGTTPYFYSIDNGTTFTTSNNITNICASTFSVVVKDDNGCNVNMSQTVGQPTPVTLSSSETPSTCSNANGQIDILAGGGMPPYNYSINDGATFSTGSNFNGLLADSYNLVVTDQNNCPVTGSQVVTNQPAPIINFVNATNPLCNGDVNGSITITASGGTGVLNYSLNGGTAQTSNIFSGLTGGTYTVVVEDENGCTDAESVTLTEPTPVNFTSVANNLTCFQNSTGSISLSATGGTGAYQYSFDNGATFGSSASLNFISAGTYNLLVQDVNGCQATGSEVVNEPALLEISAINTVDPSCYSSCDGSINLNVQGGTTPYNYTWFNVPGSPSGAQATGLCEGNYNFEVIDDNGCQVYSGVTLVDPPSYEFDSIITNNPSCNGDCDGVIQVYSTDAVQYSINGGAFGASNSFNNLCDGSYLITVTNNDGCEIDSTIIIEEPNILTMNLNAVDGLLCYGKTDTLQAFGAGGTLPYSYNWSNGVTTNYNFVSPLVDTYYSVNVTDANGCETILDSVLVKVLSPMTASFSEGDTICLNTDQDLSVVPSGGLSPYSYVWQEPASNDQSITVSPDSTTDYIISVSDQCGQVITDTITIELFADPGISFESNPLNGCVPLEVELTNNTPSGQLTGNCTWTVDGNLYTDCSSITHTFTEVGCYDVTLQVETVNGCNHEVTNNDFICAEAGPVADFSYSPIAPTFMNSGVDFINNSSNSEFYNWSFEEYGSSTEENPSVSFKGIKEGESVLVCLDVLSELGCKDSICKTVEFGSEFMMHVPNTFTPDGDGHNNEFVPVFPPDVDIHKYELLIFNRWGEIIFESHNYKIGWKGTYNDQIVKDGVYIWKIKLTEGQEKTEREYHGHVTLLK